MTLGEIQILMGSKENEHLEFKEAKSTFSVLGDNGKKRRSILGYCVGLGNEGGGKLILGITEKSPRKIVGSSALPDFGDTKSKIYKNLNIRIEIEEIFNEKSQRIVVIHIPSRPRGKLLKFNGIPLMRVSEELLEMTDDTQRMILNETEPDWSSLICPNATINDLDPRAIIQARENFKRKNPHIANDIDKWSDEVFLNKARLTIKNKITNTAIILLGREESCTLISPAVAQISWILENNNEWNKRLSTFFLPFFVIS